MTNAKWLVGLLIAMCLALVTARAFAQAPEVATPGAPAALVLKSPDGNLAISFKILARSAPAKTGKKGGKKTGATGRGPSQLVYSVAFNGKPLLEDSALGLELNGARPLGSNVRIAGGKQTPLQLRCRQ